MAVPSSPSQPGTKRPSSATARMGDGDGHGLPEGQGEGGVGADEEDAVEPAGPRTGDHEDREEAQRQQAEHGLAVGDLEAAGDPHPAPAAGQQEEVQDAETDGRDDGERPEPAVGVAPRVLDGLDEDEQPDPGEQVPRTPHPGTAMGGNGSRDGTGAPSHAARASSSAGSHAPGVPAEQQGRPGREERGPHDEVGDRPTKEPSWDICQCASTPTP